VWAGRLAADSVAVSGPAPGIGARLHRQRHRVAETLRSRFRREGGLVQALVVARRGELDEATRTAFLRAGTAHLLAISGFHVGLLAAVVVWGVGRLTTPGRAAAAGALLAWGYVAVLGFPDAATRAAVLLTLVAVGRLAGRPVLASGALGTALLLLTLVDPGMAGRVGAQLSFAGALGLAVAAGPATRAVRSSVRRRRGRAPGARGGALLDAAAAAVVATGVTLPLVAWHFERVSLVSVPATVVATPLVALALPAVMATLVLDALALPGTGAAAALVATSAEGLLGAARVMVGWFAAPSWASIAVARGSVPVAGFGALLAGLALLRRELRVGAAARTAVVGSGALAALLLAPVLGGRGPAARWWGAGEVRLHVLDAGQGDALALRSPAGRWIVVDGGPPDGERVARALARLGVRRIELLVLTHPDADHVGGLPALLRRFRVVRVAGPGSLRGAGPWRDAVATARRAGVPWVVLGRGARWELDGVRIRTLHPEASPGPVRTSDPNHRSLVLLVEWQGVELLLTGDAPEAAEAGFAAAVGDVDILKVGHHGSRTSTGEFLLRHTRPEAALIPVGRGNRYGHPHPSVLQRLEGAGVEVWRTDRDGALTVRIDRRGRWSVRREHDDPLRPPRNSDARKTNARR
jgi:competence protein ComEC